VHFDHPLRAAACRAALHVDQISVMPKKYDFQPSNDRELARKICFQFRKRYFFEPSNDRELARKICFQFPINFRAIFGRWKYLQTLRFLVGIYVEG
jgi:hypothetical protein